MTYIDVCHNITRTRYVAIAVVTYLFYLLRDFNRYVFLLKMFKILVAINEKKIIRQNEILSRDIFIDSFEGISGFVRFCNVIPYEIRKGDALYADFTEGFGTA